MMIFPIAAIPIAMKAVAFLWVFIAIALILIILVQKGRGGGIGGAFGGGTAGSLLGTKTGDFLTWVTIGLVILFLLLAIVMAKFYRPSASEDLGAPAPINNTMPVQPEQPAPAPAPAQ